MDTQTQKPIIHSRAAGKGLLIINTIVALIYFSWWLNPSHIGQPFLYAALFFGEIYHLIMSLTFWQTIWPGKVKPNIKNLVLPLNPSVDIFITVAGEPVGVVRQTVEAAKNISYRNKKIYVLNDGFVAKKEYWRDFENLAKNLQVECITRKIPGGAKAGNINNALKQTSGEIVVILDADMVVHQDFLKKVLHYFSNPRIAFVQTPQYYKNYPLNEVTCGAWEQQEFFFLLITEGKSRSNSAIICGTNVAIRRTALNQVGGMCEDNIAEDFLTSLFIYQKGWKAVYIKEVLAEGLAPEDLLSYYKQQHRWARGSLEVLFKHNPIFKRRLTIQQKLQYLSSALFYFNGVVVVIDILIPIILLLGGITPVAQATSLFALYFLPFILLNFYTLYLASEGTLTFRAISFSQSSFLLQLSALKSVILRQNVDFAVTPKQAQEGNFLFLAYPHLFYILLGLASSIFAIYTSGINPSVATNIAWVIFNSTMFVPYIAASYNWEGLFKFNLRWGRVL